MPPGPRPTAAACTPTPSRECEQAADREPSHEHRTVPPRVAALGPVAYPCRMKYLVLVPDGCADEPLAELDGRTPLEAARMPHLARLAASAEVGRAEVIPPGLPPGSDVGNLAILGYDPAEYHTGRAPIEAAAMGVDLAPDEVAYRCNLVTVGADGSGPDTMVDFAAGHVTSEQSHVIVAALDAALGNGRDGVRFHPGVEYRHLCVVPRDLGDAECVPPHDLTGRPIVLPSGPAAAKLTALMDASKPVVAAAAAEVGSVATQIWLWGQGTRPQLPDFAGLHGVTGRLSSAVDLVRGLGVLSGIEVLDVPGATGGLRQRLRRATRRRARVARRPRLLPPARRGDRRGRAPGRDRREGRVARTVGRRHHRAAGRRPRRRAVPHPAAARPRHAVRGAHAHVRSGAVPPLRDRRDRCRRRVHRARRRRLHARARPRPHGAPARADPHRVVAADRGRAVQWRRRRSILRPTLVDDPGFRVP